MVEHNGHDEAYTFLKRASEWVKGEIESLQNLPFCCSGSRVYLLGEVSHTLGSVEAHQTFLEIRQPSGCGYRNPCPRYTGRKFRV